MKLITIQPDTDYYVWQVQVMLNNFKKFGLDKDSIVVFSYDISKDVNANVLKLAKNTEAIVVVLPDDRIEEHKIYTPTIRPNIMKKFMRLFGDEMLLGQDVFYHDCDIILTSLPNFKALSKKNKICLSDTISYIGAAYIKSKGDGLLEEMCAVVGVDPKLVVKNEKKSGGAQLFIPKSIRLDVDFWERVEKHSAELFVLMNSTKNKYTPEYPIQSWTADMWATLWNLWVDQIETTVSKELDFIWPTSLISDWGTAAIYHNAGVTPDRKDLFYKAAFIDRSPFNYTHDHVSKEHCSIKYVEEIIETGKLLN